MKTRTKRLEGSTGLLTDSCEDIGEAEVIDGIERQEVIEELLLLIVTAQEGIALVQLSVGEEAIHQSPSQKERKRLEVFISERRQLGEK